jgi:hypothetical protein
MKFEAAIYNEQVLAALKEGLHHKDLSDDWADTHYIEVSARDEEDAWRIFRRKYRSENGYVIKTVETL